MIAHHISNHGLKIEPGRSLTELEADKFVGMTLQKMGASSTEVIEALNMVRNILAEDYYPEIILEYLQQKVDGISPVVQ
jgi:hypothetical protein